MLAIFEFIFTYITLYTFTLLFKLYTIILFFFIFGHTRQSSTVIPGFSLGFYSWGAQGTIWDKKNQTRVGYVQGKCPMHSTITPVPIILFLLVIKITFWVIIRAVTPDSALRNPYWLRKSYGILGIKLIKVYIWQAPYLWYYCSGPKIIFFQNLHLIDLPWP